LTKPELTFKQILEEMGFCVKLFEHKTFNNLDDRIIYTQVPYGSYFLDFASLNKKIAIEIDGEYWHGSYATSLTANQLKRKINDAYKNQKLQKDGWKLFRIPATSLKNNQMKLKIIHHIKSLFTIKQDL